MKRTSIVSRESARVAFHAVRIVTVHDHLVIWREHPQPILIFAAAGAVVDQWPVGLAGYTAGSTVVLACKEQVVLRQRLSGACVLHQRGNRRSSEMNSPLSFMVEI